MAFERLIRFEDEKGEVVYGNLVKETPTKEIEGSVVEIVNGSIEKGFSKTTQKTTVNKVNSSFLNQIN
jgi:transcription initiation factor TFIIH subunit 2